MLDVLLDTIIDSAKLIPFLLITYIIMEYLEHKLKGKSKEKIKKSGKFGPLIGSLLGIFPQCGFSVSATNFYSARVITLGTLISVYLATSDEMLPILISNAAPIGTIIGILAVKFALGMIYGFIIDFILRLKNKNQEQKIVDLCEKEHCNCEKGIIKSALKHTTSIIIYVFILTLILNIAIMLIGEENIKNFMSSSKILRTNYSSTNRASSKLCLISCDNRTLFIKNYKFWFTNRGLTCKCRNRNFGTI